MGNVVINKKILDDALYSGYKYLEENKIKKGIKYLEFVYKNSMAKDYYLNYALITAYYNVGNFEKSKELLEVTDIDEIESGIIKDTLLQIEKELTKSIEEEIIDEINDNILLSNKEELASYSTVAEKIKGSHDSLENYVLIKLRDFDMKIQSIKEELVMDLRSLYLYNQIKNPELCKYINNFNIYEILEYMTEKEFHDELEYLKQNKYFEIKLVNILESVKVFKNFYIYFIENKSFDKLESIISKNNEIPELGLFLFQGLISNLFSDIIKDKNASIKLKNNLMYFILMHYYNETIGQGLIKDTISEEEYSYFEKVYNNFTYINNSLLKFEEYDKDLIQAGLKISQEYLKSNYFDYVDEDKNLILSKIYAYLCFSRVEMNEELREIWQSRIKLDEEEVHRILEEFREMEKIMNNN